MINQITLLSSFIPSSLNKWVLNYFQVKAKVLTVTHNALQILSPLFYPFDLTKYQSPSPVHQIQMFSCYYYDRNTCFTLMALTLLVLSTLTTPAQQDLPLWDIHMRWYFPPYPAFSGSQSTYHHLFIFCLLSLSLSSSGYFMRHLIYMPWINKRILYVKASTGWHAYRYG